MNTKNITVILTFSIFLSYSCSKDPIPQSSDTMYTEIESFQEDKEFREKMGDLYISAKNNNFETGYLMYPSGKRGYRYSFIQGKADHPSILLEPKSQINGFIHSHYKNLFPTFSGSDLRAIYRLVEDEKIDSYLRFVGGVVSADGDAYLIKIKSIQKFLRYSRDNFNSENDFLQWESRYYWAQKRNQLDHSEIESYELALVEILCNSGLILYKGNSPFLFWKNLYE